MEKTHVSITYKSRGFLTNGLLYRTVTVATFYYAFVRSYEMAQDIKLTTFTYIMFIGGRKYTLFQDIKIVELW